MPFYALDPNNNVIAADHALDGVPYSCLECKSPLKIRQSSVQRRHFFHVQACKECKQSGKSLLHEQVQQHIAFAFHKEKAQCEVPFPKIQRIADVYIPSKRLVFEVQCSFFSPQEAKKRTKDYNSQGIQVIWLLKESVFNRENTSRLTEHFHRCLIPYYFFTEQLTFYDQWPLVCTEKKYPIEITDIHLLSFFQRREIFGFAFAPKRWFVQEDIYWQLVYSKNELLKKRWRESRKYWTAEWKKNTCPTLYVMENLCRWSYSYLLDS